VRLNHSTNERFFWCVTSEENRKDGDARYDRGYDDQPKNNVESASGYPALGLRRGILRDLMSDLGRASELHGLHDLRVDSVHALILCPFRNHARQDTRGIH
jgi:hypothetical protein